MNEDALFWSTCWQNKVTHNNYMKDRPEMFLTWIFIFSGTVADNIRYGPQLKGKKLSDDEVYKLLRLADLDPSFFSKTGGELSVGQAQRVALARTLANKPEVTPPLNPWYVNIYIYLHMFFVVDLIMGSLLKVLLLDEPTSALDPISTENIEDVLVNLKKKQGMTIIIVSHSIKQIQRIADIVCLLVKGEIVEVLEPHNLSEAKHPMAQRFLELSWKFLSSRKKAYKTSLLDIFVSPS
jgi:ABC-type phosphate transport system ATPase subunit